MMKKQKRGAALTFLLITSAILSCAREEIVYRPEPAPEPVQVRLARPFVRVLIIDKTSRLKIEGDKLSVSSVDYQSPPAGGSGEYEVYLSSGDVVMTRKGARLIRGKSIFVKPEGNVPVRVDGREFRGGVRMIAGPGGISAINYVFIDDYLKGVLPAEIGYLDSDKYQAYRAQAIASRSYALSKLEEMKNRDYDLRATIMDQVYRGAAGETELASRAVDETGGMVLLWEGKPAKAYYCSCCGGHTADIRVGWPWKASYPYLYGIRDADDSGGKRSFCRESRHFRWRENWSGRQLDQVLRRTLKREKRNEYVPFSRLVDISVEGYGADGRVKALRISTDRRDYRIEGDRIRWVLRPGKADGPILRSTLFKIRVKRDSGGVRRLSMLGGGNGHGVGMCQTGAIGMSKMGYRAEDILKHYYPGVTLSRYY